jgi:eukaryotic-like serine/threonine-protein kinase
LYHINILARLISTARIEIPVTINSDGNTDVTVRRHAELGKVTNKVVYLIPGRYTVVGQRPGYRDVREDLVVLAGEPSPTLQIASTERVR